MGLFGKLKEGALDLSSLDVETFTGTLAAVVVEGDGDLIDWKSLIKKSQTSGEVELVAATHISFDGDTKQFFSKPLSENMLGHHKDAVANAQTVRQGIVTLFKDIVDGLI